MPEAFLALAGNHAAHRGTGQGTRRSSGWLPDGVHPKGGRLFQQLTSFRVRNFRSINDNGPIETEKITALVGPNASG